MVLPVRSIDRNTFRRVGKMVGNIVGEKQGKMNEITEKRSPIARLSTRGAILLSVRSRDCTLPINFHGIEVSLLFKYIGMKKAEKG